MFIDLMESEDCWALYTNGADWNTDFIITVENNLMVVFH